MKTFSQFFLFRICALISIFLLTAFGYPALHPKDIITCTLNLKISIRQGHNVNYNIAGKVIFNSTKPTFKGNFVQENGSSLPISIHLDGPVMHFILDTADDQQGRIFGTGMMDSDLNTCTGNGGGTQSGPAEDDLGNWRGEWLRQTHTIPDENTPERNIPQDEQRQPYNMDPFPWFYVLCIGLPIGAFLLWMVIGLAWVMRPYKWGSKTNKKINSSLQKISQNSNIADSQKPVVEYLVTYTADDRLFDISFQIGELPYELGECGVTIAKTLDAKLTKVTALEIWAFDQKNTQTTSRILMSHFCSSQEILRSEMEQKGEALLIQPGETVILQTQAFKVNAKILQIEYMSETSYPRSVFEKVVIQIDIWKL